MHRTRLRLFQSGTHRIARISWSVKQIESNTLQFKTQMWKSPTAEHLLAELRVRVFYHHPTCEAVTVGREHPIAPFHLSLWEPLPGDGRHDLTPHCRSEGLGCCSRFGGVFTLPLMFWCSDPLLPCCKSLCMTWALSWIHPGPPGLSMAP